MPIAIDRIDHLVLTVRDVDATIDFYTHVLGMQAVTFGDGRRALAFGNQKINLHQLGHELTPHAQTPTAGSGDICLIAVTGMDDILATLAACLVPIEIGPVPRTGATGPIRSVYFRDPDKNLIEISVPED